jgi:disulfide bond formation protein DsbB
MTDRFRTYRRLPAYRTGVLVLFAAALVMLTALGFEHLGGYAPCPLCLQQRYAYYASIPLLALALALISAKRSGAAALIFIIVALAFFANAGLGAYHAGAEWELWPGPESCAAAGPLSTNAGNLLSDLATTRVVRCDQAALRLFGLSLAGWNVIASLALSAGSAWAAVGAARR